jgi:CRISPR-associated protein Cmr4
MFEAKTMLYVYVETALHAGIGQGLGAVDLPIQRERTTDYPVLHAGGVKGSIRAEAKKKWTGSDDEFLTIFGPETVDANAYASAISFGDAHLLLFPVRSLSGTFAWVTSLQALACFERFAAMTGNAPKWGIENIQEPSPNEAFTCENGCKILAGNTLVLEELSFTPQNIALVETIGTWLAANALPSGAEYAYWKKILPKKLCILPENNFNDFVKYSTEIQTHIKLNPDTKTVEKGALWVTESLPMDSLMYLPVFSTDSRNTKVKKNASELLNMVTNLKLTRMQMGGDETTGQGVVSLKFGGVA